MRKDGPRSFPNSPRKADDLAWRSAVAAAAGKHERRPERTNEPFAVLDMPLDNLLRRRFTSFRAVYLPTAGRMAKCRFSDYRALVERALAS